MRICLVAFEHCQMWQMLSGPVQGSVRQTSHRVALQINVQHNIDVSYCTSVGGRGSADSLPYLRWVRLNAGGGGGLWSWGPRDRRPTPSSCQPANQGQCVPPSPPPPPVLAKTIRFARGEHQVSQKWEGRPILTESICNAQTEQETKLQEHEHMPWVVSAQNISSKRIFKSICKFFVV